MREKERMNPETCVTLSFYAMESEPRLQISLKGGQPISGVKGWTSPLQEFKIIGRNLLFLGAIYYLLATCAFN